VTEETPETRPPEEARPPAQEERPPAPPPPPPPPPTPPAWQPPRAPARSSGWKWGCGFAAVGCLLVILIGFLIVWAIAVAGGGAARRGMLSGTGPILLIPVDGVIVAGESSFSLLAGGTVGSDDVVRQIETAMNDGTIKAVLLRVNSPGGSAAGSQEIYSAVNRAKKKGLKVVVSMADVAASGGYYISANADRIFADPATTTGSIGVIAEHEDLSGLLGKVGVKMDTIKSGPFKDMLSPTRPLTPEERQLVQQIVMQIYGQFVTAVAEGRHMDEATVRKIGDGRVYIGTQAKELGLVDEIGGLHEALAATAKMVGYTGKPTYREYGPPGILKRLFGSGTMSGGAQRSAVTVSGGLLYSDLAARLVGQGAVDPSVARAAVASDEHR
jgi:protease-4